MLGYACINTELQKQKITTNRSMIKRTFQERGVEYAAEIGMLNILDLEKIVQWNIDNDIRFFRMSSDVFPWASEYGIPNLPNIKEVKTVLKRIGKLANTHGVRLTSHPGPFNVLCSPNDAVVENTITDLELHGKFFDMLGLSKTPYNKINIHVGATYGNKADTLKQFVGNFKYLSKSVKSRLTIENDDKANAYSVKDLMYIHEQLGIPIVFDYHHHQFNTGGLSEKNALKLALSTWPSDIVPITHYSSSKSKETGEKVRPQAHSNFILEKINSYSQDIDIMLECKAKEQALLKYRQEHERKNAKRRIIT